MTSAAPSPAWAARPASRRRFTTRRPQPSESSARGPRRRGAKSTRRAVAVGDAAGREDDLPQVVVARAERARAGKQVVAPHPEEPRAVAPLDVRVPREERALVVGAEVVNVLDDEAPLGGGGDLRERRDQAVRKDVPLDPRVGREGGLVPCLLY